MKRTIGIALCAALALLLAPTLALYGAGNPAPADPPELTDPQAAAEEEAPEGDESADDGDEIGDPERAASEEVSKEIENAVQENSADDLLNLATEMKLNAASILDLTKVITYCDEAEKKGLEGESLEYCRQLRLSSRLERGLALSKIFMDDTISIDKYPNAWPVIRSMALADLETSVEESPDLPLAQLAIGRLQMLPDGDRKKAREALDTAIELSRDTSPDIYAVALKFRALTEDDVDKTLAYLKDAIAFEPESADLLNLMAICYTETRQEEKALEAIDKALEIDGKNPRYKKTKATILAALDRKDEAIRLYDEADAEAETSLITRLERGQFLITIGAYDEAIDLFSELIEEMPLPTIFYLRASARLQKKDYTDALKDVNRAIGMNPGFPEALRLKALIYIQQERYGDAVPLLEKIRRQDPDDEGITSQLAYTMAQNDDFTSGMARIDKLLETHPDSLPLLRGKADIYLLYGRWNDAAAVYEKIVADHPGDSGSLNNYAWLLSTCPDDGVRDGAKALDLATRAAEGTNFRESYVLSTLAAAYAETGDFENARKYSQMGMELAEKEKDDRIDEFRSELESYQNEKPWREEAQKSGEAADPTPEEKVEFF
ncbi:MAG: tetratricopeptide repeat protein [Thermoguttaceae bacterium]|nr:tetratricopeptide repeat protein [Thermoguttaceae bacterium]